VSRKEVLPGAWDKQGRRFRINDAQTVSTDGKKDKVIVIEGLALVSQMYGVNILGNWRKLPVIADLGQTNTIPSFATVCG
jgi:hypothetical protein